MNDKLWSLMNSYKEVTLEIYKSAEQDDWDKVNELFTKRQVFIDEVVKLNADKNELKEVVDSLDIIKGDNDLKDFISLKKETLTKEFHAFSKKSKAASKYRQSQMNLY